MTELNLLSSSSLGHIRSITPEDTLNSKQIPISVTRLLANNMCNKTAAAYTTSAGEVSLSSAETIQTQTQINYQVKMAFRIRHLVIDLKSFRRVEIRTWEYWD